MSSFMPFVFTTSDLDTIPDLIIGKLVGTLPTPLDDPDDLADMSVLIRNIEFWHTGTTTFRGLSGVATRFTIDELGSAFAALNLNAVGSVIANAGVFAANVSSATMSTGVLAATTVNATAVNAASFSANVKLFDIEHPSNIGSGQRLRHGCLEGPETAVYVRGKTSNNNIHLPSYWKDLVDEFSITVQLTPTNQNQELFVSGVTNTTIQIENPSWFEYYYFIMGERKDVPKLVVET